MFSLGWFASGNGELMKALHKHHPISVIIADRKCKSIDWAEDNNIPWGVFSDKKRFSIDAMTVLDLYKIDYAFLTFASILRGEMINKYWKRLVNFHPAPLPEFPGLGVMEKAYSSGYGGFTYHYVDTGLDTGEIIKRNVLPIGNLSMEEYNKSIFNHAVETGIEILNDLEVKHARHE